MSSSYAISVRGLGKRYRLGQREPYKALRDVVANNLRSLFRPNPNGYSPPDHSYIWAIRDASFDVEPGEALGVIGPNGAGKSTLLKLLSQVTEPTEGEIRVRGRVASLLEVGTGFHPELTGRENIFLNGSLLGMTNGEIRRKLDEIVAFAEIEDFIDTPVKRYSSGMYVRLAFAVASHIDSEILVVDEVLAVGDLGFQKKSIEKMSNVGKAGRTVLFVSHNLSMVKALCPRAILLDKGRLVLDDSTDIVVDRYLEVAQSHTATPLSDREDRKGEGGIFFETAQACDPKTGADNLVSGDPARFAFVIGRTRQKVYRNCAVEIKIIGKLKQPLLHLWTKYHDFSFDVDHDRVELVCEIPVLGLEKGIYFYDLTLYSNNAVEDYIQDAGMINVTDGDFFGCGRVVPSGHSPVLIDHSWSLGKA